MADRHDLPSGATGALVPRRGTAFSEIIRQHDDTEGTVDHFGISGSGPATCVVLAGFMGVGKTAAGHELSDLLGYEFFDLDRELCRDFGSPAECFAAEGELWFRQREHNALRVALNGKKTIVALGGGTLTNPGSMRLLLSRENTHCVTLVADIEDIMRRVSHGVVSPARPLLPEPNARRSEAFRLREARSGDYSRFGSISTSGRSPSDVAREIAATLEPKLRNCAACRISG